MKKILTLLIITVLAFQLASAQVELSPTVIASAGNYAEAGGISLSWTLGEVAVSTLVQGDIILTQGFQQAYLKGTGFEMNNIDWKISAYPNPTSGELKIEFDLPETNDFWIDIQDVAGRTLSLEQHKQVNPGDIITVNMSSYKYGVYFFRVYTRDRQQMRVLSIRKL